MSFILDALRKSETDRQRESAPSLARMPLATTRHRVPVWAWAFMAALTASVVLMATAWWQSTSRPGQPMAASANRELPPVVGDEPADPLTPDSSADRPADTAAAATFTTARVGASPATADGAAPLAGPVGAAPDAAATDRTGSIASDVGPGGPGAGPDSGAATVSTPVNASSAPVPTLAEAMANGVPVPDLKLELLVYHNEPARRFVYINGKRYAQGQTIDGGPTVAEIRREGAVLEQRGNRFLLLPQ